MSRRSPCGALTAVLIGILCCPPWALARPSFERHEASGAGRYYSAPVTPPLLAAGERAKSGASWDSRKDGGDGSTIPFPFRVGPGSAPAAPPAAGRAAARAGAEASRPARAPPSALARIL